MSYEPRSESASPSVLDRLFAGGSIAAFAVLMTSVGEAVYLYLR
jgi:hypothetical protein